MLRRFHETREREDGFSLVELLVVIIVIGILAAIAVPLFMNQEKKARDTAAKADVSTIGKEINTLWVDGDASTVKVSLTNDVWSATYGTGGADNLEIGPASDGVVLGSTAGALKPMKTGDPLSRTNWCIDVTHPDGLSKDWRYGSSGLEEGECPA